MTTQEGPTLGRCLLYYAPINGLPLDGGGGGEQPIGKLPFSGFQMSISPPLDPHYESNSHCWGELE